MLVDNPQQGGIAHYAHYKHNAGDHCVDVLEMRFDGYGGRFVARRNFLYLHRAVDQLEVVTRAGVRGWSVWEQGVMSQEMGEVWDRA